MGMFFVSFADGARRGGLTAVKMVEYAAKR